MADAAPTSGPLKQALYRAMKDNNSIDAAAVGGIHEGFNNSDEIKYPFVTYQLVSGPLTRTWGAVILAASFDIVVRGPNPVEVNSLDALITDELDGSELSVTGLSTLIVRREEELPLPPDRNAEGKKVYANGATYSFWVDKNFDNPPAPPEEEEDP